MEAEAADTAAVLFTPAVLVNGDSICPAVLKSTRTAFAAGLSWDSLAGAIGIGDEGLEALEIGDPSADATNEPAAPSVVNPDVRRVLFVRVGAAKVFIRLETAEFCGGACEAQRALLSANPDFRDVRQASPSEADNATPYASTWVLFKGSDESYYVAGIANKHIHVYRIVAPSKFHPACDILAAPDDSTPSTSSNPIVHAVLSSLHDFELAFAAITGETNGDCGSMRTPARWNAAVHEALLEIIYRPMSSDWSPQHTDSENSFGDYQQNIKILESWALGGVYEYRAFARYREQFASAARQLTGLYTSVFHMAEDRSGALAQRNLTASVSRGMGFYMYEPPFRSDVERRFRLGILDQLPREQLESLAAEAWPQGVPADEENIVALAASYPNALRVLLDLGANPNVKNAFGKTPLMYAAQFNQPQSVDLLLQHGADPNAATIWPQDRCGYQLKTSRLTPLHYAVRYASTNVVRSLLSNGAVTFCKTEIEYGGIEGYPADWLARYTDSAAAERNQNISATEIPELQRLLRVPDDAERAQHSGACRSKEPK